MRIQILAVGRLKAGPDRDLFDRYQDRLRAAGKPIGLRDLSLIELPEARDETADSRKAAEAKALLDRAKLQAGERLIALDEGGRQVTSQAFATHIGALRDGGTPRLIYAIGGPDGHGVALLQAAHGTLSLSKMTLPHGIARILLAEQLYRAVTLLSGHPYHRT